MPFRFSSKSIFLTFPQCAFTLEDFVEIVNLFFGDNIDKGIACQENHKDGNQHLHLALVLKNPYRSTKVNCFDSLVLPPKHPNISGRFKGGIKGAFKYVMKEGNYLPLPSEFNINEFMEAVNGKKSTQAQLVASQIASGSTLDEIAELFPAWMLMNTAKATAYKNFLKIMKRRKKYALAQLIKVRVSPAVGYSTGSNSQIATWLNQNIRQKRERRTTQLWIKGPTGIGKTGLMLFLEKTFKLSIYLWPKEEKWWDGYSDKAFDLIVLDEFQAHKTITELNQVLSGDPMNLSRRNNAPLRKKDNLPVIIFSNFTPEECYHKATQRQLEPLYARLLVIDTTEPLRFMETPEYSSQDDVPLIDPIDWDLAARSAYEISDDDDPVPQYRDSNLVELEQQESAREKALEEVIQNFEKHQNIWQPTFDELNDPYLTVRLEQKRANLVDQLNQRSITRDRQLLKKSTGVNLIGDYFKK